MSLANQVELEMLALINAERANAGLNALQLNTALNDAAEDHSDWMLDTDTFSHTGDGGSSAGDRMTDAAFPFEGSYSWAENIGWQSERGAPGISDDVADIHESLMNSPGHRANILDPNLTEVGIGIEQGDFSTQGGTFDGVMVTQNFAATDGDISALRDPGTMGDAVQDDEDDVPDADTSDPEEPDTPVVPDPEPKPDEDIPEPSETEEPPFVDEEPDTDVPEMSDDDVEDDDDGDDEDGDDEDGDDPAEDTPEPPVVETPSSNVPLFAGVFFDLADAFEFRQDGDALIFETSFDALWDSFAELLETNFDLDLDAITVEPVDDTSSQDDVLVADTSDIMFDCA